ncbi:MAG TPA: DUF3857 and transglutaminase domain-containing protein [Thermoanaerobaculia bacterium]
MIRIAPVLLALAVAFAAFGDVPRWVSDAAAVPTPEWAKSAGAVVLFEATDVMVNGTIDTHFRQVVRILSPAGRQHAIPFVSYDSRSTLIGFHGWAIENGTTKEYRERDAAEATPLPWGELYNDEHVKVLRLPDSAGTIVAYEYQVQQTPDAYQTIWDFQKDVPVLSTSFQLTVPAPWTTEAHWFQYTAVQSAVPAPQIEYHLKDVPAVEKEPRMPPVNAVAGRVGVSIGASTVQTWSGIAQWFSRLAEGRSVPSPVMEAKVAEIAPASKPPLERIRAIAEYVQHDVRYVAIEIGIGGYQPHPAADVYKKQFGDCKDKVTLLRAMLRAAGFESYYVIVNADRGVVDPAFATPYTFNHAIIAIRVPSAEGLYTTLDREGAGKLLFFDPTSTSTPFGTLPASEQNGRGLLVLDNGGELVTLPAAPPEASQLRRRARLRLDASGVLSGDVEEVRSGNMAAEIRQILEPLNAAERERWVDTAVGAHLVQANVENLSIENVDRSTADVVIRYHLVARGYITRVAELSLIRPRVLGEKADAQIGARKLSYETGGTSLQTDDVEISVAPVLALNELPPPVSIHVAPLTYESKSTFDGNTLHYRRVYTVLDEAIPVSGIEEANRAFAKIAAAERSTAVFVEKH